MSVTIQSSQRDVLGRMFNISDISTWKVLVYDKFSQEVITTAIKTSALKSHGVTVHFAIDSYRQHVPEVPAIYFVEPTLVNIQAILKDLKKRLYKGFCINFTSAVPEALLTELAKGAQDAGVAEQVLSVFDRHVSFVSPAPALFTLSIPSAYRATNPLSPDDEVIRCVDRIVSGLLSVLVTTSALPVIRCPRGKAAEMVARQLDARVRELLESCPEVFASKRGGSFESVNIAGQRPLLCILDRDLDLLTMLQHTVTYEAMAHDVLGMRLNRVTVPVENDSDISAPPKPKTYDLDESDSFWTAHAADPFPVVAEAVSVFVDDFERRRKDISSAGSEGGLAAAITSMPELTEKKRSIDMHTNILSALLAEIKARSLDRYFEMEDNFSAQSLSTSVSELKAMLSDSHQGTVIDKTRALMLLCLARPTLGEAQLQELADALEGITGDTSGIAYVLQTASAGRSAVPDPSAADPEVTSAVPQGSLFGFANKGVGFANKGVGLGAKLLTRGMEGIKRVVTSKREPLICKVMADLTESSAAKGATEDYLYLDPSTRVDDQKAPKVRGPFRRSIAFVVGGGNHTEAQALQAWAKANGRDVTYGCTDMVAAAQFVDELNELGASLKQQEWAGSGEVDLT